MDDLAEEAKGTHRRDRGAAAVQVPLAGCSLPVVAAPNERGTAQDSLAGQGIRTSV